MDTARRGLLLLVDDEAGAARILGKMFREDGYDVEVAFDGAEAVGRLSRSPVPDALVVDVRLPHVDGVSVAAYARSRRADLPVMFVTSYPGLTESRAADLAQPFVVITKPVDYAVLLGQLSALLDANGVSAVVAAGRGKHMDQTRQEHGKPAGLHVEHDRLRILLARVEAVGDGEALEPGLAALLGYLRGHFEREEASHGFFAEVLQVAPRFQHKVDELRAEHLRMLEIAEAALDALRRGDAESARPQVHELCTVIHGHEAEEQKILQAALARDLGGD